MTRSLLAVAVGILIASLIPITSSHAQCVTSGNDVTCTNSAALGSGSVLTATANNGGNATATNSGTMGDNSVIDAFANGATGSGNASVTNSGTMGANSVLDAFANGNGNASVTNSGTLGPNSAIAVFANGATGSGNASVVNSGTMGDNTAIAAFANGNGNSSITNSGTIGANVNIATFANGPTGTGSSTFINSGSVGPNAFIDTFANGNGKSEITNSGTIGPNAVMATFANGNGNSSIINSGTIGSNASISAFSNGAGNATFVNSGTVGGSANAIFVDANGTGNAAVANSGTILAGVSVSSAVGSATVTNYAGSLIVGTISLSGPTKILEFVGGNYVYTLNSMAGVQVNAHGAPFVVSGNTVAVLDPTGYALEDRSVMNFTGGVSSMLQDRFNGMGIAGAGAGSGLRMGFAAESAADRVDAAHDAFAGLPSLSMSYASDDSRARNALAMYTKAPIATAPVNDITVWTSGFGGERRQSAYDNIQRARDDAFGGAIGVDRQFTPDWRFGLFAGAGSSRLRTDFNVQNVDSDYGFGGGYGRYDRHEYYVDFALFGGGISSKSTRQVANNLVGFEMASASYNGWFVSPDVTAGYRIFTNWGVVTPKARVRYVGGTLDGYTEAGSAQGLVVGARDLSDAEERLGVELSSTRPAAFGWGTLTVRSEIDAVGLQRLGDNTINAVLLAQNIAFTTPGRSRATGGAASATVDWRPKSNVSLYLSAEGMVMDDHSSSIVGKGGVRVGF